MQVHASLLALHCGRPVRMVYGREESFFGHVHRHPAWLRYEHGADTDGRLIYVKATIVLDGGAYASTTRAVVGQRFQPSWLMLENRVPGPTAPPLTTVLRTCGDHADIRATSVTAAHTCAGVALIVIAAVSSLPGVGCAAGVSVMPRDSVISRVV